MTGKCIPQRVESPCRLPHYSLFNIQLMKKEEIGISTNEPVELQSGHRDAQVLNGMCAAYGTH